MSLLALVAAVAVLASAFLPWRANWTPSSFDTSANFLWNVDADVGWFSIGLVMLVVGLAVLGTVLMGRARPYRRIAGGVMTVLSAWWLVALFRLVWDDFYGSLGPALGAMFTQEFAVGPWLALAAGLALLLKRR